MSARRFFVEAQLLQRSPVPLRGPLAHQLSRVLRLKPGDQIELLDNSGEAYVATLEQVHPDLCLARVVARHSPSTEPRTRLVLYQAISKGPKLDWVCQKAVELGVAELVPTATARCIGAELRQLGPARLDRLQRIAQEAAEQSGRARVPRVRPATTFSAALEERAPADLGLIGALAPEAVPLRQALTGLETLPATVRLYIGPEGGFEQAEVTLARARGVQAVSLGPRVLRTETAGLALLAIVAYALGELEPR